MLHLLSVGVHFGERTLFEGLDLAIGNKDRIGLVGRNGAGKSNFFDAVQFCLLAPRFYNLRQEERQRLLHEGSGATATSAYVEITFDNSSGRVPIEGDDVTLRRAIGAKKDEFFVRSRRPVVWRHAIDSCPSHDGNAPRRCSGDASRSAKWRACSRTRDSRERTPTTSCSRGKCQLCVWRATKID